MKSILLILFSLLTVNVWSQALTADSVKTLMWESIHESNPEKLELAFRLGGQIEWYTDDSYLLIHAVRNLYNAKPELIVNKRKIVESLIRHGADINYSYHPLEYKNGFYYKSDRINDIFLEAVNCNDTVILELFANKGIKTIVFSSYYSGSIDLPAEYKILLQYYPKDTVLRNLLAINALARRDIAGVKILLKNNVNINTLFTYRTGLEIVIETKDTAFLSLVKDLTQFDKMSDEITPLAFAYRQYSASMLIYFINHGADVNEVFFNGDNILSRAIDFQDYELVKAAIAHGADINRKNKAGNTPLYQARLKLSRQKVSKDIVAAIELAGGKE